MQQILLVKTNSWQCTNSWQNWELFFLQKILLDPSAREFPFSSFLNTGKNKEALETIDNNFLRRGFSKKENYNTSLNILK